MALYVHLPWCVRKCRYCDFNSHPAPESLPETEYVEAVLADLDADLELASGRMLGSIFFGGGTPSLFSPAALDRLLTGVRQRLPLAAGAEITLEANPGTTERGRFADYAQAGINRVSLGAQSFERRQLAALGRIHGPDETLAAVTDLRSAGITNFNLDLLYGLPGQTVIEAAADLEAALALDPPHLSCYQLTIEPGTSFARNPPALPTQDAVWEMEQACAPLLAGAGLQQYEVSAWARPGMRCRHNLNYWGFGDYLGVGAGAHGKITTGSGILRTERAARPDDYMRGVREQRSSRRRFVPPQELPFEFMLNALRLRSGFTLSAYENRTGLPTHTVETPLQRMRERGLMEMADATWRPTALGYRFLSDLQSWFL
ncbi:MAG: radical SAM family heme chaperone HemW [Gammaproteobacteria bacterium]|nr:radical SAM family heme chaperone HemW [Gammaproteobacteria bacterium]